MFYLITAAMMNSDSDSNAGSSNSSFPSFEDDPNKEPRKPRTLQDFKAAVDYMLMYADYDSLIQEDVKFRQPETQEPIIMENVGATNVITSVVKMEQDEPVDDEEDDEFFEMHDSDDEQSDSYNYISCFCGKPYAKRPMIECSRCLTWLHLTCVNVKKNNIPETFYCQTCRTSSNPDTSDSQSPTPIPVIVSPRIDKKRKRSTL